MTTSTARRMVAIACTAAAALALPACGSEQPASSGAPGGATGTAVSTRDVPGVGTVLADPAGKTLYFTDSDEAGSIRCVASCTKLWLPAMSASEMPDGGSVTGLSVVKRPEGSSQLAYQNKPLYTFTLDSSDKPASGHNASDSFDGVNFTWHAVVLSASDTPPKNDSGGGYGGGGGY